MKKILKIGIVFVVLVGFLWCGSVVADRKALHENVIRLHVVAASDSREDQDVKLRVRDAVTETLETAMADITDPDAALAYIRGNVSKLEGVANRVLEECGVKDRAKVTLAEEEFGTRVYDTFSLPAGVYRALRITIGEGAGHNWWCVVFPTLCFPATTEGFVQTAEEAGFQDSLACALSGEEGYEVRFFLLDALGRLENMFRRG